MTQITRENVQRVAKELVEEYGDDYVYPGAQYGNCSYQGNGKDIPACLVGQIVQKLDPDMYAKLVKKESYGDEGASDFDTEVVMKASRKPIIDTNGDYTLSTALMDAQSLQDDGHPWGEAVERILSLKVEA